MTLAVARADKTVKGGRRDGGGTSAETGSVSPLPDLH
jgi:hypothetical protein